MIHLRNGQKGGHGRRHGTGATWCGKKLLGDPEIDGAIEIYTSYGNQIRATFEESLATCDRCKEAFDAAYKAAFPEGPKPIATFKLDDPDDMERARRVLNPDALRSFFAPGGTGMAGFEAALKGEGE